MVDGVRDAKADGCGGHRCTSSTAPTELYLVLGPAPGTGCQEWRRHDP